MFYA